MRQNSKDKKIVDFVESHSYSETAKYFKITIRELWTAIQRFNLLEKDVVFRYCEHHFIISIILHKNGIEYSGFCKKCRLSGIEDAVKAIKDYPNALIVANTTKDCDKPGCPFCQ